jgi:hypothetical protein
MSDGGRMEERNAMTAAERSGDSRSPGGRTPSVAPEVRPGRAWELVEAGRYRPLRIRGSFPGRELG